MDKMIYSSLSVFRGSTVLICMCIKFCLGGGVASGEGGVVGKEKTGDKKQKLNNTISLI